MGFLSGIGDILKQFSGNNPNTANASEHFDQVAKAVPCESVANGLAAAFRSGDTPPFSQMASQLFSNGDGTQKAAMLTTLLSTMGPGVLSKLTSGGAGSSLGSLAGLLQGGQAAITPEQAASVNPQDVQALAEHAHQDNPSIVDKVSQIYAQHPTLIKTLGTAAVAIAMKKIAEQHNA